MKFKYFEIVYSLWRISAENKTNKRTNRFVLQSHAASKHAYTNSNAECKYGSHSQNSCTS